MPILIAVLFILFFSVPVRADLTQGVDALNRGDGKAALQHLLPSANKDNDEAQYYLGRLYYYPISGIRRDYRESAKWFRLAAEKGHVAARYKLGGAYLSGKGVAQDDGRAVHWWLLAAREGHHEAQNNLGAMFANGRGVPQSLVAAYALQLVAARNGNELAPANLTKKEALLGPDEKREAMALSERLGQSSSFDAALAPYLVMR
ncbi:MAG: hypothetical protein A2512_02540 [Deltaproteobacteria bacterium RIFOXYD12_FULL_56_24]|nr:MAG: hypothetical protein A2512_02540 [Deltaproteobacteria bacterium RIFOXYD12_FULL_56_24]